MSTATTPWEIVEAHLIRTGVISPDGITRRAQPRRCRSCQAPILIGLDAPLCALRADVDPQPLSALGEALAHLEDRRTYALCNDGPRIVLDYRDAGRIAHRPAGTGRFDVMAEHRCGPAPTFPTIASFTRQLELANPPEGAPCPY
jgi:hypothetical protein